MIRLVIVAHSPLASALQQVAAHAFPEQSASVLAVDVGPSDTLELVEQRLKAILEVEADTLIMVDVFGATPCNAARRVADGIQTRVLSGVNVPMIWRALCYGDQPLDKLIDMAQTGAAQGIVQAPSTFSQNQLPKASGHVADHTHDQ